jgi:hypothetical protein
MKMQASDLKTAVQNAEKGSALQALVDGFFAGLEARTTNGIVQGLLKGANKLIDFAMTAYGLAILLCFLFLPALASAQGLPRARDVVADVGLPRARDYVEVTVATQIEPPCKNCDCGCIEGQPCSCDKPGAAITKEDKPAPSQVAEPSAPAESTTPTSASAGEEEAGVYSVPAAQYQPQRFFRYRPAYQRGRACSS